MPFPNGGPLNGVSKSSRFRDIAAPKRIEITSLTFHVTSSVTNYHSICQLPSSYLRPFAIRSLNPAVFEILRSKRIGVTSLAFQGHVTSSVTSRDHLIAHVPFPIGGPIGSEPSISNGFQDIQR